MYKVSAENMISAAEIGSDDTCSEASVAQCTRCSLAYSERTANGDSKASDMCLCGKDLYCSRDSDFAKWSHLVGTHSKVREFSCACGALLRHASSWKHDLLTKRAAQEQFSCMDCEKVFLSESSLRLHRRVHASRDRLTCEHCGKVFTHICGMTKHLNASCMVDQPFFCDHCGVLFNWRCGLLKHDVMYSFKQQFQCADCFKSFDTARGLKRHRTLKHFQYQTFHTRQQSVCSKGLKISERSGAVRSLDTAFISEGIKLCDNVMVRLVKSNVKPENADSDSALSFGSTDSMTTSTVPAFETGCLPSVSNNTTLTNTAQVTDTGDTSSTQSDSVAIEAGLARYSERMPGHPVVSDCDKLPEMPRRIRETPAGISYLCSEQQFANYTERQEFTSLADKFQIVCRQRQPCISALFYDSARRTDEQRSLGDGRRVKEPRQCDLVCINVSNSHDDRRRCLKLLCKCRNCNMESLNNCCDEHERSCHVDVNPNACFRYFGAHFCSCIETGGTLEEIGRADIAVHESSVGDICEQFSTPKPSSPSVSVSQQLNPQEIDYCVEIEVQTESLVSMPDDSYSVSINQLPSPCELDYGVEIEVQTEPVSSMSDDLSSFSTSQQLNPQELGYCVEIEVQAEPVSSMLDVNYKQFSAINQRSVEVQTEPVKSLLDGNFQQPSTRKQCTVDVQTDPVRIIAIGPSETENQRSQFGDVCISSPSLQDPMMDEKRRQIVARGKIEQTKRAIGLGDELSVSCPGCGKTYRRRNGSKSVLGPVTNETANPSVECCSCGQFSLTCQPKTYSVMERGGSDSPLTPADADVMNRCRSQQCQYGSSATSNVAYNRRTGEITVVMPNNKKRLSSAVLDVRSKTARHVINRSPKANSMQISTAEDLQLSKLALGDHRCENMAKVHNWRLAADGSEDQIQISRNAKLVREDWLPPAKPCSVQESYDECDIPILDLAVKLESFDQKVDDGDIRLEVIQPANVSFVLTEEADRDVPILYQDEIMHQSSTKGELTVLIGDCRTITQTEFDSISNDDVFQSNRLSRCTDDGCCVKAVKQETGHIYPRVSPCSVKLYRLPSITDAVGNDGVVWHEHAVKSEHSCDNAVGSGNRYSAAVSYVDPAEPADIKPDLSSWLSLYDRSL